MRGSRSDRFIARHGDMVPAQCTSCVHLNPGVKCAAFPEGIPKVILMNAIDHRQPFPGDHGIQFELKPDTTDPYKTEVKP